VRALVVGVVTVIATHAYAEPCRPGTPAAACAKGASVCAGEVKTGEWRYALVAPLYEPAEDLAKADLVARWRGGAKQPLQMTADTRTAMVPILGDGDRVDIVDAPDPARWAIVPVDQLSPAWKIVSVDGHHPLTDPNALAVPLCRAAVSNFDRTKLTTLAMTGVTAMTRNTAALMDHKGVTYPVKDIEPWLAAADVVHISNEVSFVQGCKTEGATMEFCSKDSYIKLMEAAHTKIVELDGSHLSDFGRSNIDRTLAMYRERGWKWFGGGHDELENTAPMIYEHHGNRIAFVACNYVRTSWKVISPGPEVTACDMDRMEWQVRDLRKRGYFVIAAVQHEEVYVHVPPDSLVRDFRRLAAAGANFVFGSQSHCAHPWEMHYGAFVHYGPGNLFFDQMQSLHTREAANDLVYIYQGRLLGVGHLFTMTEEYGRPRPMTDRERTSFLREMTDTLRQMPRAKPAAVPPEVALDPRPDSFFIKTVQCRLSITTPPDDGAKHPLVIDCGAHAREPGAFVATPVHGCSDAVIKGITEFMTKKYAVDPARVTTARVKR
jgi:poly-gamma-glutamate synthesis protein (capsule biosynthesis protein)